MSTRHNRKSWINEILKELNVLKNNCPLSNRYALEENIAFFQAAKTIFGYIRWLITRAGKINKKELLELTDLQPDRWDREMHEKLIEVERMKSPGLIRPLVDQIISLIITTKQRPLVLANLGCGGMEIERQVIRRLISVGHNCHIIFIGIDKSPVTQETAIENLQDVRDYADIVQIENLDNEFLQQFYRKESNKFHVILCKNDIFKLDNHFPRKTFDIIYHSLFKHHLNDREKLRMDEIAQRLSKHVLEYDGYRSWLTLIPQTITAWNHPIFLNASILSNFRFLTKKELKTTTSKTSQLCFYKTGTYLLIR
jgi:SAM-dependent methyltransferase